MKKLLLTILILVGGFASIFAQSLNLEIDFTSNVLIENKLGGVNTGPTFNELFETPGVNSLQSNACGGSFFDKKVVSMTPNAGMVSKTAEIKPNTIRFPGGTLSNFYHLYEYTTDSTYDVNNPQFAKGFGTRELEVQGYNTSEPIGNQYCQRDQQFEIINPTENPNIINGFANYVLEVENEVHAGGDADYKMEVIFVANVFAHFKNLILTSTIKPEKLIPSDVGNVTNIADPTTVFECYYKETKDAIDYLINRGVDVVGVEYGNEFFFANYTTTRSDVTGQRYMELCDIYTQRLKLDYPAMKFAVLTDPGANSWNNDIQSYSPVFYDAITLHKYYNETDCLNNSNGCAGTCTTDIENDRTCRFDCGKCSLGDFVRNDLMDELEAVISGYDPEIKIWFTEWSLVNPDPNPNAGKNTDFMNTLLYSSFILEHMMQQFKFNAEQSNRIEYSTHHRLSYKSHWGMLSFRLGESAPTEKAHFYVYKMMQDLTNAAEVYHFDGATLINANDSTDFYAQSFIVKEESFSDPEIYFYYTNKTANNIGLNLMDNWSVFEGQSYNAIPSALLTYQYGSDTSGLYSSFGKSEFLGSTINYTTTPDLLYIEDQNFTLGTSMLPAFSAGVLKISVESFGELNNISDSKQFKLYPNPTKNDLTISSKEGLNIESFEVLNMLGQVVVSKTTSTLSKIDLDVSQLANGTYFVKLLSEGQEHKIKFEKQ